MTAKAQSLLVQAQKTLLTPYGLDVADLNKVFGTIMAHDVDYADLYFQYSRSEAWSLEEGIVKSGSFNIEQGVGVRAISGEKTAFAYSDDISCRRWRCRRRAVRAIAAAGAQRLAPPGAAEARPRALCAARSARLARRDAKVKLLERLEAMARAEDPRVSAGHGAHRRRIRGGPGGRQRRSLAADVRPLVRVSITVIIVDDKDGSASRVRPAAAGAPTTATSATPCCALCARGGASGGDQPRAKPAPAGTMTVVLGSGWPGILLHEASATASKAISTARAVRLSPAASASASRPRASPWSTTARSRSPRLAQHRRRRQPDAAHGADRGRHPQGLHAGQPQRAPDGRRADRQRPPRVLRAPAAAAHDQHHDAQRRHEPEEIIKSVKKGSTPSISAAARSTSPTASSSSRCPRPT
jgi:hypothetical protein